MSVSKTYLKFPGKSTKYFLLFKYSESIKIYRNPCVRLVVLLVLAVTTCKMFCFYQETPGFVVFHLRGRAALNAGLSLELGVENLSNAGSTSKEKGNNYGRLFTEYHCKQPDLSTHACRKRGLYYFRRQTYYLGTSRFKGFQGCPSFDQIGS